jgi:predicted Zn-dependent protease
MNIDRYWAQHIGAENNSMFNVYVPGGNISEDEMMKMVPRGLIINRFWYIRFVDMKKGELTGMTRDGVLYFEDGQVRHAVNNLRFNEIPHEMTRRILALGKEKLANPAMVVPTMLIDGFNFVDKTTF